MARMWNRGGATRIARRPLRVCQRQASHVAVAFKSEVIFCWFSWVFLVPQKSSSMWRGSQSTGCLRCRLEMLTLGVFCFGPVRYTFRPAHLQYSRLSQVDHIGNPFYSVQPQVHWESCESWRCFVIGKVVVQHALHSRRLSSQRSFGTCGRLKPRAQGTCDKHMTAYHHITTDNLWQPTVRRALIFQQWSDICC